MIRQMIADVGYVYHRCSIHSNEFKSRDSLCINIVSFLRYHTCATLDVTLVGLAEQPTAADSDSSSKLRKLGMK